ncbi:hypothetical protein [Mesorhizobium sangaii]|uniref:Uncharacterized protein n=1 Tax=Mesorhizobium sangaii TaxID=505389 RepID=A0A841PEY9_9HYPH|nr:hypothetical protein [Mesorhizobium sangaii]MBB6408792.1 hypothetical protein [Mesorhizobium sangaii]
MLSYGKVDSFAADKEGCQDERWIEDVSLQQDEQKKMHESPPATEAAASSLFTGNIFARSILY